MFQSNVGNVTKPLRMALGSLIIQKKSQYSDRELVEQSTKNLYLQYFIVLPDYQDEPPFDASTLVLFRKRLDEIYSGKPGDPIIADSHKVIWTAVIHI